MVATYTTDTEQSRSSTSAKLRLASPPRPSWARTIEDCAHRGGPVPVAVVLSIVDDWLDVDRFGDAETFDLDDTGRAHSTAPSKEALTHWLSSALGAEEGAMPAAAHALFYRLAATDTIDPGLARSWIKEALGAPAPHQEVAAWIASLSSAAPEAPAPVASVSIAPSVPVLAVDLAAPTADLEPLPLTSAVPYEPKARSAPPRPASLPPLAVDLAAPTADLDDQPIDPEDLPTLRPGTTGETDAEGPLPIPEAVVDEADIPTDPPMRARGQSIVPRAHVAPPRAPAVDPSVDDRAVVRHVAPRDRPVALAMAPAARKSAQPVTGGESIILPAERRGSPWWLMLFALIAGAVYALFFR